MLLLLVLLGFGLIAWNFMLGDKYSSRCPKCGRQARRQGYVIYRGKHLYSYKCSCGWEFNDFK